VDEPESFEYAVGRVHDEERGVWVVFLRLHLPDGSELEIPFETEQARDLVAKLVEELAAIGLRQPN
jgi:hypothetical protein